MKRFLPPAGLALLAALALNPAPAAAQAAPADASSYLAAGAQAPDVPIAGATRWGPLAQPVRLSDFRGKTVILAFFPAARTRGCTIQMKAYRDQYAELFRGGRNVVLIAISNDPADALASWAEDEDFPFLFGSDVEGDVYRAFGGTPSQTGRFGRTLVVVNPEGKVETLLPRFMEVDPTSYIELAAIVDRITPAVEEAGEG